MSIYYTADTHFFHANVIKYCPVSRGQCNNVEEMNEKIISAINSKVSENDTLYHLGDFAFANIQKSISILERINCKTKILVAGNHDHKLIKNSEFTKYFQQILPYHEIRVDNQFIIMSHYPILSWNGMERGSIHLHGHTHNTLKYHDKALDVGIDGSTDLSPWEHSEVINFVNSTL